MINESFFTWNRRKIFQFLTFENGYSVVGNILKQYSSEETYDEVSLLHALKFIIKCCENDSAFLNQLNSAVELSYLKKFLKWSTKDADVLKISDEIIEYVETILCSLHSQPKCQLSAANPVECFSSLALSNINSHITSIIIIQRVNKQMSGQNDIGFSLWPSAVILSKLLHKFPHLVANKACLEIASGLGLCGIAAAKFTQSVTITDYNDELLATTQQNVELNTGSCLIQNFPGIVTDEKSHDVMVKHLDWTSISDVPSFPLKYKRIICNGLHTVDTPEIYRDCYLYKDNELESSRFPSLGPTILFDVIFGSDIVCAEDDAVGAAITVKKYLAMNGKVIFICPLPQHRWGTELLIPCLQAIGLSVHWKLFHHSSYKNDTVSELLSVWESLDNCSTIETELFNWFDQNMIDEITDELIEVKDNCAFMVIVGINNSETTG